MYMGRVNGELAMSRAIGDYQYKDNEDLQCDQQMVSCYPDIAVHVRSSSDQLLVLACDGVWDVMTNVESINFLQEVIQTEDEDMSSEEMAEALIDLAFGSGSTDNISSIVVKLNNTIKAQETMIDSLVNDVKLSKKRKIDEKVIDSIVIETAKLPHKVDKKRKVTP